MDPIQLGNQAMAGAAILPSSRKRPRGCKHGPLSLPLDLLPEIAARSDPATLVRCAATCKELRRHIADPAFRASLRLRRHADQRFVRPSLLRGGLVDRWNGNLMLVDDATAEVTGLLRAAACFPRGADGKAAATRTAGRWRLATVLSSSNGWLTGGLKRSYACTTPPPAVAKPCLRDRGSRASMSCSSATATAAPLAGRSKFSRPAS